MDPCRLHAAVICFALVVLLLPEGAGAANRYGVVVGSNLGNIHEDPLKFAETDARRYAKVLQELGQVNENQIELLIAPGKDDVESAFAKLSGQIRRQAAKAKQSVFFFYFAGHGDSESLHLGRENLRRSDLLSRIRALPSKLKLVVIDACQTPKVGRKRGVSLSPAFEVGIVSPPMPRGTIVINSTQNGEPAHESDVLSGALFTHHLLSALRGAGDVDRDGRVTLQEAYNYSYHRTVKSSSGAASILQKPIFDIDLTGNEDFIWTSPSMGQAVLVLPSRDPAAYFVFHQHSGTLIAEAVGSPENSVALAVRSGRLIVHRRLNDRVSIAEVDLQYGGRHRLQLKEFEDTTPEILARRGVTRTIYPHRIHGNYEFSIQSFGGDALLGHGARLVYSYDFQQWVLSADVGVRELSYNSERLRSTSLQTGLGVSVGPDFQLKLLRIHPFVGLVLQLDVQRRVRWDAETLKKAGMDDQAETNNSALGYGGHVGIRFSFPIVHHLELHLGTRGSIIAHKITTDYNTTAWNPIYIIGFHVGAGYRF